ncbi:formate dehydrogenase [Ottowia sp.]|uniref:formate dehydrogenase n=1 Tax=Ottowia sp. TaxID=1898956 RepID=UPI001DE98E1D|nr:formate dehydrogenase [Ottowia sp.]MCP5259431.1 formate dehydrogenase [Burkholderiaceae bacterium]HPK30998.1 formate dehydrogenase [Ottowia sp.]
MKTSEPSHRLSRRVLFAGAGVAGAAAVAAAALPVVPRRAEPAPTTGRPAPEKGGGYALTEHVKRYYKTARV